MKAVTVEDMGFAVSNGVTSLSNGIRNITGKS